MEAVVLDTSAASLLHPRKRGSTLLAWYEPRLRDKTLVLSFQGVAEFWARAIENRWSKKDRRGLERFLGAFLIVPYEPDLARTWAEVSYHCKRKGRRLEAGDAWIVATAVHRRLPLITHDRDQLGLTVPKRKVVSALTSQELDE
jgi:tRNA(fMet)-specific endonuclease VapC